MNDTLANLQLGTERRPVGGSEVKFEILKERVRLKCNAVGSGF